MKTRRKFRIPSHGARKVEKAYSSAEDSFYIADLGCGPGGYHDQLAEQVETICYGGPEVVVIGVDSNSEYSEREDIYIRDVTEPWDIPERIDFVHSNHLFCQLTGREQEDVRRYANKVLEPEGEQLHHCTN